jgi:probable HAF family extracellular repeat protein/parallel beta-helix repeat protein
MTDLGTLGGPTSVASRINDAGQVVGYAYIDGFTAHAYLYSGGGMTDLGTLGGWISNALGINHLGQVAGFSNISGSSTSHAFLYTGGRMTDLGTLGGDSIAEGINDAGQVVGYSYVNSSQTHAFLYTGGRMRDLNDLLPSGSGWELVYASAINNHGQVVGWGERNGYVGYRAFRFDPRYLVTNTNDSGPGSLREAILDANAEPGDHTITFEIGEGGTQTISLTSALPPITHPVIIDGTSQPGFAGSPLIVLNGAGAGSGASGLTITGGNSTVKGLVINGFDGNGIVVAANGGNTIQGDYIGTDATGTAVVPNHGSGILIDGNVSGNTLGGTTQAAGNIISGNGDGIEFRGATGNVVQGNYIGTDASSTLDLGNSGNGIFFFSAASNNTVGGTEAGAGNVIAFNHNAGIAVGQDGNDLATGNTISRNSIYSNRQLGIDLGSDGVSPEHLEPVPGPNNGQNYRSSVPWSPARRGRRSPGSFAALPGLLSRSSSSRARWAIRPGTARARPFWARSR